MTGRRLPAPSRGRPAGSEVALVARAQRGDEAAFQALFEAHRSRVYSLCLRMTGSTTDAEDLTQEAFLKVFRKISTFRGASAFSTWLHRLAKNEVLMHLRKKRLPQVPLDEIDPAQEEPVARDYPDHDRRLIATVDRIDLTQAIAQLPQGYRAAVVLFELEGYDHREIALMMNCSVGTSKSQLHRARWRLYKHLSPHHRDVAPTNQLPAVSGNNAYRPGVA